VTEAFNRAKQLAKDIYDDKFQEVVDYIEHLKKNPS